MSIHDRDDLWTDHDGQSRVLDYEKVEAEIEGLRSALASCESWMDRWASHVGSCKGDNQCTCGRAAILHEARAALANGQETPD